MNFLILILLIGLVSFFPLHANNLGPILNTFQQPFLYAAIIYPIFSVMIFFQTIVFNIVGVETLALKFRKIKLADTYLFIGVISILISLIGVMFFPINIFREIRYTISQVWFVPLILYSLYSILNGNIKKNLIAFFICSFFGIYVLYLLDMPKNTNPLILLFISFFTIPSLIFKTQKKTNKLVKTSVDYKQMILLSIIGSVLGLICEIFPIIGTNTQIIALFSPYLQNMNLFLLTLSVSISHALLAYVALKSGLKTRIGIYNETFNFKQPFDNMYLILSVFSAILGLLLLNIGLKIRIKGIEKVKLVYLTVLLFLIVYWFGVSGILAMVVGGISRYFYEKTQADNLMFFALLSSPSLLRLALGL